MSTYDYVKRTYQVNPRVGGRVTHQITKRSGTIVREKPSQGHYVMVKFDGAEVLITVSSDRTGLFAAIGG
jgi:hypothetical protein